MEYKFNGKMSLDDYVQFNRNFMIEIFFRKKASLIFIIFGISIFIGYFIYNLVVYNQIRFYEDILPAIIFVLTFVLLIFRRPKIFYKNHFTANKLAQEEQFFVLNDKEIIIKTESINIILTNEKINKIKFDKDTIYIFTAIRSAYLIKSRYFDNINEFSEVVNFIKNNYNK
jgi:hypothetical protein